MKDKGRALIAALLNRGYKPEFYSMLTEDMFENSIDKKVLKVLKDGYKYSPDKIAEFRQVTGLSYSEVVDFLVEVDKVKSWVTEQDILEFVEEYKTRKIKELVNRGEISKAFEYFKETVSRQTNVIEDYKVHLEESRQGADNGLLGLPTGIPSLDAVTSGFRKSKVWVIGGYNAYGKSYFMTNMVNRLIEMKRRVCVITLEMTKEDILDRLIGERLGIGVYELAKTVNRERVAEQVAKIEKNINDLDLCILDTLYDIEDIEMRLKIENKNRKIDVVFVDFIQLVRNKESKSKYESLSEVSEKLQELAKELGVCMVILSQISNEAQKDDSQNLYGFKGAGEIGQIADVAIRLQRFKDKETSRFTDEYNLLVVKNRSGETGGIGCRITFPGGTITEVNLEQQEYEQMGEI